MNGFSRRGFLKALGVSAGALAGTRLVGSNGLEGEAQAQAAEPSTIVMLHLVGGMNAMFGSAESLRGRFGITANNFTKFGPVAIDNTLATAMPTFSRQHVAAIGVRHGLTSHPAARTALFSNSRGACTPLVLASAMGGNASIKACILGSNLIAERASTAAVNGVSLQRVNDMQSVIESLGGSVPAENKPDREGALAGLKASQKLSGAELGDKASMASLRDGYGAIVDTLERPVKAFDFKDFSDAYALNGQTTISSSKSKLAAAELMARAGANVVVIQDRAPGWDTHRDANGAVVRNQFTSKLRAPMGAFLDRMLNLPDRNVVVVMFGDFARSLPNSDHQPNLTALVFGKYVRRGSTGTTNANVGLAPSVPGINGFWAYVGAAAKIQNNPFGNNPHGLIV